MAEPKFEGIIKTILSGGTREAITLQGVVLSPGSHPVDVVLGTWKSV